MTHAQLRMRLQRMEASTIAEAIYSLSRARDGRGRWRPQRVCAETLASAGLGTAVDEATAQAVANIGALLAKFKA